MNSQVDSYSGSRLVDFVKNHMSMSANYQPVVIKALVSAPGYRMAAVDLARELLLHDEFAVGKALGTLMRWPKRTLAKREVAYYDRMEREFFLPVVFDSNEQREEVLTTCDEAISCWQKAEAPRSASRFYHLIEVAGGRCQACGVLASVRPLDIDHVIPREKAKDGYVSLQDRTRVHVDDERNLQILCTKCNRGKRDASVFDFRPSADRFTETIRLTLELASEAGYDPRAVLAAALNEAHPGQPGA